MIILKSQGLANAFNIDKETLPGTIVLVLIVLFNIAVLSLAPEKILSMTKEDGVVEYAAAASYSIAAIFLLFLFFRSKHNERTLISGIKRNLFFLLIAILLLVFAGEEISWGQRIFNFNSPEIFSRLNRQGETNIHNLNFWEALDTSGNQKHGIIRMFSSVALYTYFWFTFCLIVPVVNRAWPRTRRFFRMTGIPVINMFTGLLFLLNFIVFEFFEKSSIELRSVGEIKETNFALLYLAASISLVIKYRYMTTAVNEQPAPPKEGI